MCQFGNLVKNTSQAYEVFHFSLEPCVTSCSDTPLLSSVISTHVDESVDDRGNGGQTWAIKKPAIACGERVWGGGRAQIRTVDPLIKSLPARGLDGHNTSCLLTATLYPEPLSLIMVSGIVVSHYGVLGCFCGPSAARFALSAGDSGESSRASSIGPTNRLSSCGSTCP